MSSAAKNLANETPEAALMRLGTAGVRSQRGQFFTPQPIAEFMAAAVNRADPESVLDPGVGGGVLLRAIGPERRRFGCDIDRRAVRLARRSLVAQGGEIEIAQGDFLNSRRWPLSEGCFDAVIANPPYIRHHQISRAHKALAGRYWAELGVRVSSLSSSYVYFLLEAILRLRRGGRLVFITPSEFLDVRYGVAVKEALLNHCDLEEVVVFEGDQLAFDHVLTTSTVTLATRRERRRTALRLTEGNLNGGVKRKRTRRVAIGDVDPGEAWTRLLPARAKRIRELVGERTAKLDEYARIRRGIATGDNSFFCLNQSDVERWRIEPRYLVPALVGARDLPSPGLSVDKKHLRQLRNAGRPCWLLWCHESKKALRGTGVARYIRHGEAHGTADRFNCRARKRWYSVEQVESPDFFVTYMSRQQARFVRNLTRARCMSSLLNLWALDDVDLDLLEQVLSHSDNAQLLREFGRTYGGGLGKIEPGELSKLPVPALDLSAAA